jgi:hypothetical protein
MSFPTYRETAVDFYITGSTSSGSFVTVFSYNFAERFRSYLGLSAFSLGIVVDNIIARWRVTLPDGKRIINDQSIPNQINIIWPKRIVGWYENTREATNPLTVEVRSEGGVTINYSVLVSFIVVST